MLDDWNKANQTTLLLRVYGALALEAIQHPGTAQGTDTQPRLGSVSPRVNIL